MKKYFQKILAAQTISLLFEESLLFFSSVNEKRIPYNDAKHGKTDVTSISIGKRWENTFLGVEISTFGDVLKYKNQRKLLKIKGRKHESLEKILQVVWKIYHIEIMA